MRFYPACLLIVALVCAPIFMAAQENHVVRCFASEIHEQMMQNHQHAADYERKKRDVAEYLSNQGNTAGQRDGDIVLIPVAVHYNGVAIDMACAIAKAQDQIDRLNKDFAGTNFDINLWDAAQPTFPGVQNGESCIQFCLASLNHPAGYGLQDDDFAVTIDQVDVDGDDQDADWSGYLNFYIRNIGVGVLGYAPLGGTGNGDGVTISPDYFSAVDCGGLDVNAPYDLGRTVTHEVGHYLLLDHPWADGGCASDDDVADTPVTDQAMMGCPNLGDVNCVAPVLWMSYMDYCDDQCLYMFSAGQVARMEGYVNTNLQNLVDNNVTVCQEAACIDYAVSFESQQESCEGFDASINLEVVQGTAPFQYSIFAGAQNQANGNFGNLSSGTYNVRVEDDAGCVFEQQITVDQESAQLTLIDDTPAFCSDNSGTAEVLIVTPGDFEYSANSGVSWQDSGMFDGLAPGDYTAIGRNASGCQGTVDFTIRNEHDYAIAEETQNVNCPFQDNGMISLSVSGGQGEKTFSISPTFLPTTNSVFDKLEEGSYTVRIRDERDCVVELAYNITENFSAIDEDCPCEIYIPSTFTPDGDGLNESLIVVPSCELHNYKMEIFDRWGKLVFTTNSPRDEWRGDVNRGDYFAQTSIYHYKIEYIWGATGQSADVQTKHGNIVIPR